MLHFDANKVSKCVCRALMVMVNAIKMVCVACRFEIFYIRQEFYLCSIVIVYV
jgi:hypothetical protein